MPRKARFYLPDVPAHIVQRAAPIIEKLAQLDQDGMESCYLNGLLLGQLGSFEEAEKSFRKAVALGYPAGQAYFEIAMSRKYTDDSDPLIEEVGALVTGNMLPKQRAGLYFGLGKIHDDLGQWDKTFGYFQQGNQLCKPPAFKDFDQELFEKTSTHYDKKLFDSLKATVSQSDILVFIVGMPRSGTTLIEKIIASHPEGSGAGELLEIERLHTRCARQPNWTYMRKAQ
jgi:tetratricopeptide (TPR) repeat protein